ncbi:MAG: HEAT repeat domain-containing protein [Myxococcaceae bacterium]
MRTPDEWIGLLASPETREKAEQALVDALTTEDQALRMTAAHHLLEALPDASDDTRGFLLYLLQAGWSPKSQRDAVNAVETLLGALQRAPEGAIEEADHAALILGRAARYEATQREVLLAALDRPESLVRRAAAGALGRAGELSATAAQRLAHCLTDDEPVVAEAALQSIGAVTPELVGVVLPSLANYASICHGVEQYGALAALHGLLESNPAAGAALPVEELLPSLERAVSDSDPALRLEAASLMGWLGKPQATKSLTARLADDDPDVRAAVAVALLRLGNVDAAAPALGQLLRDADPAKHGAALAELERLDEGTLRRVKPVLETAAKQAPEEVRAALREVLG